MPEIVLVIDNELGVPVKIKEAQIVGRNPMRSGDEEFTIGKSLDGLVINAAATPGESAKTIIRISKTTETEFEAFISLIPSNIRFDFEMQVGTGKPDLNQFVGKDNKVRISFQFRLPLIFELDQLVISDTLAFNLGLGVGKNKLLSGSLISTSLSSFPFELSFQTYFLDSLHTLVDSLITVREILQPAEIDANGRVTKPSLKVTAVGIDPQKIDNLRRARFAVPVFVSNTLGDEPVAILSTYTISLKLTSELNFQVNSN